MHIIFTFSFPLSILHSPISILNLVLFVPCHMDPNQFNWQAYMNLLQNYQQPPSNKNLQHPLPLFPQMSLPLSSMSENSQIPPHFIPYLSLPPPPLVTYKQFPSIENFQVLKHFLRCHKTPSPCSVSLPIVVVMQKLFQMRKLIHNFNNFLLNLG